MVVHLWEALSNFDPTPLLTDPVHPCQPEVSDVAGRTTLKHPNRKLSKADSAELVAAYVAGAQLKELAAWWGMHAQTVNAHVRRAGVKLRPKRVMTDEQVAVAVERYTQEGWSILRLSRHFGRAEATIRTELTNAGVTLRGRGRPRRS